jgi:hypothetical protein
MFVPLIGTHGFCICITKSLSFHDVCLYRGDVFLYSRCNMCVLFECISRPFPAVQYSVFHHLKCIVCWIIGSGILLFLSIIVSLKFFFHFIVFCCVAHHTDCRHSSDFFVSVSLFICILQSINRRSWYHFALCIVLYDIVLFCILINALTMPHKKHKCQYPVMY